MEVNTLEKRRSSGRSSFKFSTSSDGILLNIHHTVRNHDEGTVVRVRFTATGFTANNERLIAVDHRNNLFVFDLVHRKHWFLPDLVRRACVVEGILEGHLVAIGSKDGTLFIIDLKQCIATMKGHSGPILRIVQSPAHCKTGATSPDPRYLLVTSADGARVYTIDGFTEVSHIDYGLTANSTPLMDELHWFSTSKGAALIGHTAGGTVRVHRTCFKLTKELNATKLIELHLKNRPADVTMPTVVLPAPPPPSKHQQQNQPTGNDRRFTGYECDEPNGLIKRITQPSPPAGERCVVGAQVTPDGRYYALLYQNSHHQGLAFLALDSSWLICRVVLFPNLFIKHFAFAPTAAEPSDPARGLTASTTTATASHRSHRWSSTMAATLLAHTALDNDLLMANVGYPNATPRTVFVRLGSPGSNCYKWALAPNGRMLANVLASGEVLLHNLQHYALQCPTSEPAPPTEERSFHRNSTNGIGVKTRSSSHYYYSCVATGSGTTIGTPSTPYADELRGTQSRIGEPGERRRMKTVHQMDAVQSEITRTLPKERLLPILREYGEYPARHRATIWRAVLELPGDTESYGALLQRGQHPCVADYENRYGGASGHGYDQRTVRNLKKIVSCLAHWCPVFGLVDYVPDFVLPFVRHQPTLDALALFETVATVLLNQCQLWFEFAPLEPFNYLALVGSVLDECEPRLAHFYRRHGIEPRAYALPLMQTAFLRCCAEDDGRGRSDWQCLWDHVLSNEPYYPVFLIVAYNSLQRGALMKWSRRRPPTSDDISEFFRNRPPTVDVRHVVRRAYELMDRQYTGSIHPRHYIKSFVPLNHTSASGGRPSARARIDSSSSNSSSDPLRGSETTEAASSDGDVDAAAPGAYACFSNFPKKATEARCAQIGALQAEQRRIEAKIIELEKLEHSLQDRMVNDLIRQEHEHRLQEVERDFEAAITREEQRVEMQRKLLLLHRKQLRERESELSLDLHNAKLIGDATVRERELESLLTKLQREKEREETELLFAEEHLKLREREQLVHYVAAESGHSGHPTGNRPLDQRYQTALEQLAVQKQKLYDEIDRAYSSLGAPSTANEYTYRTVSELRKVATIAGEERYPTDQHQQKVALAVIPNDGEQIAATASAAAAAAAAATARVKDETTSQVKLYEEKMRKMERQVRVLEQLKSDINRRKPFF
ncbi:hypothetical protein AND_002910 [Anopheles darlingi]|uniref:TBC1 domain family member 31 n=1 Tax=Anopheles darlingi TaxID=43151 RepID=W5JLS9_ANODA|nr:hypothetical protein AND_002910 [Anopheles darlingi]